MSLRQTQKLFSEALNCQHWQQERHPAEDIICDKGMLSPRQRLEIYRNTGITARINVLAEIYPVCRAIIGERPFTNLAHDYAIDNIPNSPDLNLYGIDFPQFIQGVQSGVEFADYQYLHDLCMLEAHWHGIYYRQNDPPFDFEYFEKCSHQPEGIFLTVSYALESMQSDYPIHHIWQKHKENQEVTAVSSLEETEYLCVYRDGFTPKVEKTDHATFALLNACREGDLSLQDLSLDAQFSAAIQALPTLINRGWVSGFSFKI